MWYEGVWRDGVRCGIGSVERWCEVWYEGVGTVERWCGMRELGLGVGVACLGVL